VNLIEKEKKIFFIIIFLIDFIIFYLSHYFTDLYLIEKNTIIKPIENKPFTKNKENTIKEIPQTILKKDPQKPILLKSEFEDLIEGEDNKGEDVYLLPM
jgi:hypothetical protein